MRMSCPSHKFTWQAVTQTATTSFDANSQTTILRRSTIDDGIARMRRTFVVSTLTKTNKLVLDCKGWNRHKAITFVRHQFYTTTTHPKVRGFRDRRLQHHCPSL